VIAYSSSISSDATLRIPARSPTLSRSVVPDLVASNGGGWLAFINADGSWNVAMVTVRLMSPKIVSTVKRARTLTRSPR
jgi:hypothetical protein